MSIPQEQLDAMLAAANRAAVNDDVPDYQPPGESANGKARPARPGDPDPSRFSWHDLGPEGIRNCEEYTMPGGKSLFVFPLSSKEAATLLRWSAAAHVGASQDSTPQEQRTAAAAAGFEIMAMQVALCCYMDRERKSPCFDRGDVPALTKHLPVEVVKEIVELSTALARRPTRETLAPFFSAAESSLRNWLAACGSSTDCPPGLKDETTDLLSRWPEWS